MNSQKIVKDLYIFAKVAKFRQIWPHGSTPGPFSAENDCPIVGSFLLDKKQRNIFGILELFDRLNLRHQQ